MTVPVTIPGTYMEADITCPNCLGEGTVYGDWEEDSEMEEEGPVATFHGSFICISCQHSWTI